MCVVLFDGMMYASVELTSLAMSSNQSSHRLCLLILQDGEEGKSHVKAEYFW
jgi:hypothetical protein